jgi:small-conductance mechanosensitive channel/CRP-like cAMP-binding protein
VGQAAASNSLHTNAPGLAQPPQGVIAGEWWHNTRLEAWADASLLLVAGLIVSALLAKLPGATQRSRVGAASVALGLHLLTLPILGILAGETSTFYVDVRFFSLAMAGFAAINILLIVIFDGVVRRLGADPPLILSDVIAALLYLVALVFLLSQRGVNLSGLIATSAVLTAIIGFSLQDTLGNIIGGMSLQLEKSIDVGDWIKFGEHSGRVVEIRWRQTSIETRNWETVVIPNSQLVKMPIVVLGKRGGQPLQWRRWVYFSVDYRHRPTDVIRTCQDAIRISAIAGVADEPPPDCVLLDMQQGFNHYAVRYWLTNLAADDPTDSVVRTRLYFALKRANIPMAIPPHAVVMSSESENQQEQAMSELAERRRVLRSVERNLFAGLEEVDLDELAVGLTYAPFAAGEVLTRQGAEGHYLYLISRGRVSIRVSVGDQEVRVATLEPGQFFGERSLMTGEPRSATAVAETDVVCYRLDKASFAQILHRRPELAEVCAEILALRQNELDSLREGLAKEQRASKIADDQIKLVRVIKNFFGL